VIAALAVAIAPVFLGAAHVGNTTPYDLLARTVVTVCAATALLRDRPRWWLGAGVAAGIGIEDEYLILALLGALVIGILVTSAHRAVMKTRWPWLGGIIALVIWLPNLIWQFASGWPQLTMASALHQQNTSTADYIGGLPAQLVYAGLLGIPLVIAGFITLWRTAQLRFLGVAATLILIYVLVWIPGKTYYVDGILPVILAAGSVSAERWIAKARGHRRPRAARHRRHLAEFAAAAADREPAQGERGKKHRRRHRLAAADGRNRGAGRGAHPGRPAASVDLYGCLRGGRHARCVWRAVPHAARDLGSQHVLAVGTGARIRHEGAVCRRGRAAEAVLRELPAASCLQSS
jgi:hypothetical protein